MQWFWIPGVRYAGLLHLHLTANLCLFFILTQKLCLDLETFQEF